MRFISIEESKWRTSWITVKDAICFRIYEETNVYINDLASLHEANSKLVLLNVILRKPQQLNLEDFFNNFFSVPPKANIESGVNSLKVR